MVFMIGVCFIFAKLVSAGNSSFLEKRVPKPWLTAEYQFDTRNFNTLNFTGAAPLLLGFDVSGFVDFESPKQRGSHRKDLSTYFLELNLKRHIWEGFGFIAERNSVNQTNNEVGRLGIYFLPDWKFLKKIHLNLSTKIFPYETDKHGWQASWSWGLRMPYILGDRISFAGFMDFNFDSGSKNNDLNVVTDHQFRFRLVEGLRLLVEYRHSDFLSGKADTNNGVGFGLQYKF